MSITLKLPDKQRQKMKSYYQDYLVDAVPYSDFRAKINGTTITAYTSGKVLFQGKQAEKEAQQWENISATPIQKAVAKNASDDSLPQRFSEWTIIGNDEVGNGSYFGALTVASCYLPKEKQALIRELGVKDSKLLSDTQIRDLAWQIKATIPYALTICNPSDYNRGVAKLNANGIKVSLHNFTIQKLLRDLSEEQKNKLQGTLIDQFTPEANYYKHLKNEHNPYTDQLYFVKKGESHHLAVACASIIARDAFLESLEVLGEPYGVVLPSGANQTVDQFAARLIKQYGVEVLDVTAKKHFKNTEKAMKIAGD
ncbi:ribonuclease HIII [Aerococcaceae bacterium DSM 111020]|nr:ribonuclease HIII [Aerococcaceae bacterium DSM 111020]